MSAADGPYAALTALQIALPSAPASAGRARQFVAGALHDWSLDRLTDEAVLLTSEVVTNALLHAGSHTIRLRLLLLTDGIRVEVDDDSVVVPRPRRVSQTSDTGRGIGLVEVAARSWGTRRRAHGKTVWFEVATP